MSDTIIPSGVFVCVTCPTGKDPGQRGSSEENSFPKPLIYWKRKTDIQHSS